MARFYSKKKDQVITKSKILCYEFTRNIEISKNKDIAAVSSWKKNHEQRLIKWNGFKK